MTLVVAWLRKNDSLYELVVASDSRISGGESWDACPKVMALPRPGTVMAMSGDAAEAYTFLLQAINTCNLLDGNLTGRTGLRYFAKKLRDAYADLRNHVSDLPFGQKKADTPKLDVAVFGWSWRDLRFEGYSFSYDPEGVLRMHNIPSLRREAAYPLHLMGDAASDARRRIHQLMKVRELPRPMRGDPESSQVAHDAFLQWEPLEVIVEMAQDEEARTVGGTPQVIRIYQYGQAEAFVWRTDDADYFGGRPVQSPERFDRRIMRLQQGEVVTKFSDRSIYFGAEAS
ncbi:hypothetical protein [Phytohabitans houttuyneae]|uniref:Uncharacterized protein n=1 Tax=Phytohabitans houttuyneae TaxID=1076126 RepID=A0A6V8K6I7_9ACTN|nr:hypothetical protein [Phytohabitans houttuyneae]GFJ77367.1 hypothetical protein Phou_015470 [Phytohabitans houttuyneae]